MTTADLDNIPELFRCESVPKGAATDTMMQLTKELRTGNGATNDVYTVHQHIDAPPDTVYNYLLDINSVEEFTYSLRNFHRDENSGLYVGLDATEPETKVYLRIHGNPEVRTVDYESAFDQGTDLWMVFCGRVLSADHVQQRSGSLVSWTIWRHPYYARNPYPELAPNRARTWPGSFWPLFYAMDVLELRNLKYILEYREQSAAVSGSRS